jgi:Protein kinase domain
MHTNGGPLDRGTVVAGYRIDDLIGRGGMGFVYRATHLALGRIYALKVLAPEYAEDEQFRERFRREIRVVASLRHPHIVGIHYAGEHQGLLFLVMDLVSGSDLDEVMRVSGALEPSRATAILTQVASALDAAHEKGLVHRDVKPANILLTVRDGEEHAYLTDFGIAKKLDTVTGIDGLTRRGAIVGTVDYMAPEQAIGGHKDARTDVYALGCVYYQMLSGKVPYEREDSVATLYAQVHEPPPTLSDRLADLYPTFGAVIEKAMAKEPEGRYLSAGDFARDANAALAGSRSTSPPSVVGTGEADPLAAGAPTVAEPVPARAAQAAPGPTQGAPAAQTGPPRPVAPVAGPAGTPPALQATVAGDESFLDPEPEAAAAAAGTAGSRHEEPPSRSASGPRRGEPPPPPGPRRRRRRAFVAGGLAAAVLIAAGVVAVIATGGSSNSSGSSHSSTTGSKAAAKAAPQFAATVSAVPDNRVTGNGSAKLTLRGNVATVTVDTNGLVSALHFMHIHGGSLCPVATAATVINGNRFISANSAQAFYGTVVASLTKAGAPTTPRVHVDPALYPTTGDIRYTRTITLGRAVAAEIRRGQTVVVVHGIDYNKNGRYDNSLGSQGELTAPALCGRLAPTRTATASTGPGSARTYAASLALYQVSWSKHSGNGQWNCYGVGVPPAVPPTATTSRPRAAT